MRFRSDGLADEGPAAGYAGAVVEATVAVEGVDVLLVGKDDAEIGLVADVAIDAADVVVGAGAVGGVGVGDSSPGAAVVHGEDADGIVAHLAGEPAPNCGMTMLGV